MERIELRDKLDKDPGWLLDLADEGERARSIELLWGLALDGGEPKQVRKAAKKALYMLKSRGSDVDRFRPVEKPERKEKARGESITASFLSLPDSAWNTLHLFVFSEEGMGSHTLYQAIVHPERGITKLSSQKTSKKHLEKYLEQNSEVFSVPEEYALFRFRQALRTSASFETGTAAGTNGPGRISGLDSLPEALRGNGDDEVPHPVHSLVASQVNRILKPDEESELFSMTEIARLTFLGEEVPRYKEQIDAAKKSRLIVANRSPDERIRDIVESFIATHFPPARRAIYSRILFDIAFYFFRRGQREEARILVEYGKRLANAGPSLKDHPLVRYLVYKEFLS
jgi:hypothetical protein